MAAHAVAPLKPRPTPRPRWIPLSSLAAYLAVKPRTLRLWIKRGTLKADSPMAAHYADDRPRVTGKGRWRVYETDLQDFLLRYRAGKPTAQLPRMRRK